MNHHSPTMPPRPLSKSLIHGALAGLALSIAGFAPWALFGRFFYQSIGEAGLYAVCAVVFIGLSAPLFHRLLSGTNTLLRFYGIFTASFSAYAVAWTTGWMLLRGHPGSFAGLFAGAVAMAAVLALLFKAPKAFLLSSLALFIPTTIGYFIGGAAEGAAMAAAESQFDRVVAMFLWSVGFGPGFGIGLALALRFCQNHSQRASGPM